MEGDFFKWLSMIEGLVIVCMLGWEIFWLRRMYQVLDAMPTAGQIREMVDMIKKDKEAVIGVMNGVSEIFMYGKTVVGTLMQGMLKNVMDRDKVVGTGVRSNGE